MKLTKFAPKKNSAQSIVEFALVLPILLLLLYGLLETGRLLFIYSTIVTASRQAVRYGSATGLGSSTTTVPRYQDCAGIRAAAQKADYLNAFNDTDIYIYHDDGPNPPNVSGLNEQQYCTGGVASDTTHFNPTDNTRRIVVVVKGNFIPIVRLIPFMIRSNATGNPITARSARTVLVSVPIDVTAPPPPPGSTATFTATSTATATYTPPATATFTPGPTSIYTSPPQPTAWPTSTGTATASPTIAPTPVLGCGSISASQLDKNANYMFMTINNPNLYTVTVKSVYVVWNDNDGHRGSPKSLVMQAAELNGLRFWSGNAPQTKSTITPAITLNIPTGNSTIYIFFDLDYNYWDNPATEEIKIELSTPGCESTPIRGTR